MNDQPRLILARHNLRNDLVERHDHSLDLRRKQFERKVSGGKRAGDSYLCPLQFFQPKSAGSHNRGSIFLTYTAAAGHENVSILNVRISMEGNGGHIIDAFHGLAIQGLDIRERVVELETGGGDLIGGKSVKHEGIVGIWTVSDTDIADGDGDGSGHGFFSS